jgi:hypothetical protein
MSRPHTIRLHAAWSQPMAATGGGWSCVREFGRPTGVTVRDRVWLILDAAWMGMARLNGHPLPSPDAVSGACGSRRWACDVGGLLVLRNHLELTTRPALIQSPWQPAGRRWSLVPPYDHLCLEIETVDAGQDSSPLTA